MNVFDYAIKMEEDGCIYYHDLAEKSKNAGLKNILTMLAEDETKHYEKFKEMQKNNNTQLKDTSILQDSKNIFQDLKDKNLGVGDIDFSEKQLYIEAMDLEQKSIDFYNLKANEIKDHLQKNILLKIRDEEKKHFFLLENIIDFLSRPATWIEDAGFNHLEDGLRLLQI